MNEEEKKVFEVFIDYITKRLSEAENKLYCPVCKMVRSDYPHTNITFHHGKENSECQHSVLILKSCQDGYDYFCKDCGKYMEVGS